MCFAIFIDSDGQQANTLKQIESATSFFSLFEISQTV